MAKRRKKIALDPERFAPRLREIRETLGLSQQDLGERAGVSQKGVSQWETLYSMPDWDVVLRLCEALGVMPEAFLEEPREGAQPTRPRGRPKKEDSE